MNTPPSSNRRFANFALAYDHFSRDNAYNNLYERPAMRARLPADLAGLRILDAGCAGGVQAEWMARHGATVTALDLDPDMVEIAQKRLGHKGKVVQADLAGPLGFLASGSVDVVFCSLTLHYLRQWETTLADFHRILAPRGMLLISTHHPMADYGWGGDQYFTLEPITQTWTEFGDDPVEVNFFRRPLSAIVAALVRAGFVIDAIEEPQPVPEMREVAPKAYEKLSKRPWFIIFAAHTDKVA